MEKKYKLFNIYRLAIVEFVLLLRYTVSDLIRFFLYFEGTRVTDKLKLLLTFSVLILWKPFVIYIRSIKPYQY